MTNGRGPLALKHTQYRAPHVAYGRRTSPGLTADSPMRSDTEPRAFPLL